MAKIQLFRKSISVTEVHQKMMDDLLQWEGIPGESELIRRAVAEYYRARKPKEKPAYVKALEARQPRQGKTPVERATDEVEKKEILSKLTLEKEKEKGMSLAQELTKYGGRIIKESDGSHSCEFPTYSMTIPGHVERGEMKLPFSQLTEELVANQFEGDKEAIIKIIESQHGTK